MRPRNLIVLDENLDPELGEELEKRGYEAAALRDLDLLSVKDEQLLPLLGNLYRDRRWTLATTDRQMPKSHARAVAASGCALAILENAAQDAQAKNDRVHRWAHRLSSQSPGTVHRYFKDTTRYGPPPHRRRRLPRHSVGSRTVRV